MIRNYTLTRKTFTQKSTIGELTLDGVHVCYVLEDKTRSAGEPKVWGETAIGYGRYQVVITKSERFSKAAGKTVMLPLLLKVPLYEGIRIHTGNWATDSEGCLIVGAGKTTDMVTDSKKAFKKVYDIMKAQLDAGDEIWLTITK